MLPCRACSGMDEGYENCPACGGKGEVPIARQCPLQEIPGVVWEICKLADWMDQGLPPVAGGVLDQTPSFMEALALKRTVEAEIVRARLKR